MAAGRNIKGITIEIDGDATKLTKALKESENTIRSNANQLKDVNNLLKLDPGNTELLTQKYNALTREIEGTKDKLQILKEAQSQMVSEGKVGTEEYDVLQREIVETEQKLKGLTDEYKNFGSVQAQQVAAAGEKMKDFGGKMSDVGSTMTKNVTVPIVGLAGAAIKTAADFDSSMSKVAAISGATGSDFEALRNKAREMGETTKYTASDAAEAMNYMAMAGWKTSDMLAGIQYIMNLAAASGEDLGTTSDIVTDALTAFGLTAADSGHFADILATAAANANTNVGMMGASFKYVAPVAGAMGYKAEDVAIALGLMANSGIKADMAGSSLRNMLTNMANPTDAMAIAMDRLGLSLDDGQGHMYSLQEIMGQLRQGMTEINMPLDEYNKKMDELDAALEDGTIKQKDYDAALEELNLQAFGAEGAEKARAAAMLGGKRAMAALLAISEAAPADYQNLTDAIYNCEGATQKMADTMMDNAEGQWQILISKLQELAISFGDILMPVVREAIEYLQQLADKFNSLDDDTKEMIVKIGLIVAAAGPLLLIGGKLITGVGSLLTLAPKLVGGITSIGGAISKIGGGASTAASSVSSLGSAAGSASGGVSSAAGAVGSLTKNALGFIALGAGILLACAGLALLAQSAIALSEAGPGAVAALVALVATIALFAAGAAALAPALTAGAVGLVAFGAAVALVGVGVLAACAGLTLLAGQLPTIVEYGGQAAIAIAQLGAALVVFAAGCTSASGGLTLLAAGLVMAAGGLTTATVAMVAFTAAALALTVGLVALTAGTTALAVAIGVLAAAILALGVSIKTTTTLIIESFRMVKKEVEATFNGLVSLVEKVLGNIESKFKTKFEGIKTFISGVVDFLKKAFNFEWKLPDIKLPHFKIDGKLSLDPPSMPKISVDWYQKAMDKGMILNSPTIFGAAGGKLLGGGEAGSEAVVGTSSLQSMITGAVAAAGVQGDIIIPVSIGTHRLETVVVEAEQINNYRSGGR